MTDFQYGPTDEQGRNQGGQDHASDRCYECGHRGHTHLECSTEPWTPPLEPRRPTIKEAFALTDAVIYLDMVGHEGDGMKIGSAFPGQYIKASDLNGKRVVVIIEGVEIEDIGSDRKPVLHFKGKERGLVLNKTNANSISMIVGTDETDQWTGKRIVLFPSRTDFQGKTVPCIRVDPPQAGTAPAPTPPPPVDEFEDDSEEVPF